MVIFKYLAIFFTFIVLKNNNVFSAASGQLKGGNDDLTTFYTPIPKEGLNPDIRAGGKVSLAAEFEEIPRRRQAPLQNTCASHAAALCIDHYRQGPREPNQTTSAAFLNGLAHVWRARCEEKPDNTYDGKDVRVAIAHMMLALKTNGYCSRELWPEEQKNFLTQPPRDILAQATPLRFEQPLSALWLGKSNDPFFPVKIVNFLKEGHPLIGGIPTWGPGFRDLKGKKEVIPPSTQAEELEQNHAVVIIGYDPTAYQGKGGFEFINSWGPDWADKGIGLIPVPLVKTAWCLPGLSGDGQQSAVDRGTPWQKYVPVSFKDILAEEEQTPLTVDKIRKAFND